MSNDNKADVLGIRIEDYDYPLPDGRIALHPLAQRDECRLLVRRADATVDDLIFTDLPDVLPPDAMLVYNNTRVINARLIFHKAASGTEQTAGARIEVFCLEPVDHADYAVSFASESSCTWLCFVGNSRKWKDAPLAMPLTVNGRAITLNATRTGRQGNASVVRFEWDSEAGVTFSEIIAAAGVIPIPPYLNRDTEASDSSDYQTIYSHIEGSVAAPTAGLHFTDRVMDAIDARGIVRRELTLHVGAGTFQPVKSDSIGEHDMHSEFIAVRRALIAELARGERPVIAVGTTSVRTLESLYHIGCLIATRQWTGEVPQWYPYDPSHPRLSVADSLDAILNYLDEHDTDLLIASTRIIIASGYTYRIVKGMVTNFHQPRSTLLLLVSAFIGDVWRELYRHALDAPAAGPAALPYRFLSYGDAMLLLAPDHA